MAQINHTIITGQSLAVFNVGASLAGTQTRPTEITYFFGGTRFALEKANNWPERSFADQAAPTGYYLNVRTGAQSGADYTTIKKGTATYTGNINNLDVGYDTAVGEGHTVVVRSIHFIHGEADRNTPRATYAGYLAEWISDYNTDCKAITGQATDAVGIANQTSQYADSQSGYGQLDAHRAGDIVLLGPIYQLDQDGALHLSEAESFKLGELHARAYRAVVVDGGTWEPVHPGRIDLIGNELIVRFHVPVEPLVFDTDLMVARTNYGFSYTDDTSSAAVSSVAITGDNEVTVTLDATPTGANGRLKYGATAYGGNLRDSSTDTSVLDDAALPNWCCAFDDPIDYDDGTFAAPEVPTPSSSIGAARRRRRNR